MKLAYISLVLLLISISLSSAITTTLLPSYQPGETIIIEIQGSILEPILNSNIVFKRNHVAIATDYDIKRIGDKYYLYAQAPLNSNNYTLFINRISTTLNGQNTVVNYNQSFSVAGNLTDYSISPGFIITNKDFSFTINSNSDQRIFISSDFPAENAITLNPGANQIKIQINSLEEGIYIASIGKYKVPIQIISSNVPDEKYSLKIFPSRIKDTLPAETPKTYNFSIINQGSRIENIYSTFEKSLFDVNPEKIIKLDTNESINLSVSLKKLNGTILKEIIFTKDNSILGNISFQILFTNNKTQMSNNSSPGYYCSELGGEFCSSSEICSTQTIQALDGSCCTGTCNIEEKKSSFWIIYVLIIIILIVVLVVFLKYRKAKINLPIGAPIESVLRKPI